MPFNNLFSTQDRMDTQSTSWKVISIFISSTFLDMDMERDYLKYYVLPRLETEFAAYRLSFQLIDLRWGVVTSDIEQEQEKQAAVLNVCFNEIKRSRPYFIGLIGERYGWIPPAQSIKEVMSRLNDEERTLFEQTEDTSITELEMQFGGLGTPELLQNSLFYFRDPQSYVHMDEKTRQCYSDLARLEGRETQRKIAQKLTNLKEKIRTKFSEAGLEDSVHEYALEWTGDGFKGLDVWGDQVFNDLKKRLLTHEIANRTRVINDKDEQEEEAFRLFVSKHIEQFTGRRPLINRHIDCFLQQLQTEFPNDFYGGKWGDGYEFRTWENSNSDYHHSLLTGRSGKGKSSLFCQFYDYMDKHLPVNVILLGHSAGVTPESCHLYSMFRHFCKQLARRMHIDYTEPDAGKESISQYTQHLRNDFDKLCQAAAKRNLHVAIMIDALDRFLDDKAVLSLSFLLNLRKVELGNPKRSLIHFDTMQKATYVRLFWGTCTEEYLKKEIEPYFKLTDEYSFLKVEYLEDYSRGDATALLKRVLANSGKELPETITQKLLNKQDAHGNRAYGSPLWIILATNILSAIDSYDFSMMRQSSAINEEEKITLFLENMVDEFSCDPQELFLQLLDKAARRFGKKLVYETLTFIAFSWHGLSDHELEELMGKDWNAVEFAAFRRWFSFLINEFESEGKWSFGHKLIQDAFKQTVHQPASLYQKLYALSQKHGSADEQLYYLLLSHDEKQTIAYLKDHCNNKSQLSNSLFSLASIERDCVYHAIRLLIENSEEEHADQLRDILETLKYSDCLLIIQKLVREIPLEKMPSPVVEQLKYLWADDENLSCEEKLRRWSLYTHKTNQGNPTKAEQLTEARFRLAICLAKGQMWEALRLVKQFEQKHRTEFENSFYLPQEKLALRCAEALLTAGVWKQAKEITNALTDKLINRVESHPDDIPSLLLLARICQVQKDLLRPYISSYPEITEKEAQKYEDTFQEILLQLFSNASLPLNQETKEYLLEKGEEKHRSLTALTRTTNAFSFEFTLSNEGNTEVWINELQESDFQYAPTVILCYGNLQQDLALKLQLIRSIPSLCKELTEGIRKTWSLTMYQLSAERVKTCTDSRRREEFVIQFLKDYRQYVAEWMQGIYGLHLTFDIYKFQICFERLPNEEFITYEDVQEDLLKLSKRKDKEIKRLCALFYLSNDHYEEASRLLEGETDKEYLMLWILSQLLSPIKDDHTRKDKAIITHQTDVLIQRLKRDYAKIFTPQEKAYLFSSLYLHKAMSLITNLVDAFFFSDEDEIEDKNGGNTPDEHLKEKIQEDLQKAEQWLTSIDRTAWNNNLKEVAILFYTHSAFFETYTHFRWPTIDMRNYKPAFIDPTVLKRAKACMKQAKDIWNEFPKSDFTPVLPAIIALSQAAICTATGNMEEAITAFNRFFDNSNEYDFSGMGSIVRDFWVVNKLNYNPQLIYQDDTLDPEAKADKFLTYMNPRGAWNVLLEEANSWAWNWKDIREEELVYRYRVSKKLSLLINDALETDPDDQDPNDNSPKRETKNKEKLNELFRHVYYAVLLSESEKLRQRIIEDWHNYKHNDTFRMNFTSIPDILEQNRYTFLLKMLEETGIFTPRLRFYHALCLFNQEKNLSKAIRLLETLATENTTSPELRQLCNINRLIGYLKTRDLPAFARLYASDSILTIQDRCSVKALQHTYRQLELAENYWHTPSWKRIFKKKQPLPDTFSVPYDKGVLYLI